MIESEFNTENLPAGERFGQAREAMSQLPSPLDVSDDHIGEFRLHQRVLYLDTLRVWTKAMQPLVLRRTAKLIRQSDPETYNIVLLQHGMIGRTWGRHEATYGLHDLHARDSSQPYELRAHSAQGLIVCMGVEIPKKLLPLPQNRVDWLVGRRLPAREGIGALLGGFLARLTTDTASYMPSDGPRLSTVLVDLTSALFAHALEIDDTLAPETRQSTLILRIRAFIQQHLHDPHLDPGAVAAAHHISTSYLHRLFQSDGVSVAAWIREQRLTRVRRDLADPAMATTPIGDIAARWGFTRPAVFSRVFRTAYGIAPRDYRRQALHVTNQAHSSRDDGALHPDREHGLSCVRSPVGDRACNTA